MSENEGKQSGQRGATPGKTKAQPQPDKDWYRKWQEGLHQGEKQGPR